MHLKARNIACKSVCYMSAFSTEIPFTRKYINDIKLKNIHNYTLPVILITENLLRYFRHESITSENKHLKKREEILLSLLRFRGQKRNARICI